MRLTNRTTQLEASPIAEAHAWLEHRQSDRTLLDLSQAAPNYPTAPAIADRIAAVAYESDGGRYAPPPGLPSLNEVFAAELSAAHRSTVNPSNVLPTGGCNQAFCVTTSAITEPGDEVIIAEPYYFNHDMWLRIDGIKPRYLTQGPDGIPNPEHAADLVSTRTRAIVLVSPGNPTGVAIPPEVLRDFFDLAQRNNLALIIDETYRNFRITDEPSHSLYDDASWTETLVTLHSFSKDLAIPGYRVGAIVAGSDVLYEIMKVVDCVQISAPRIGQEAVITGLTEAKAWRSEQTGRINSNLEHFRQVMADEPGGFFLASAGAFFGWIKHPFAQRPTADVIKDLVLKHDVLAIPGTAFTSNDDGYLRFSYANLSPTELNELGMRLEEMSST